MNNIANQLAQSLFKKNTLQECSRWELEILADKYPYFGIAQFLLAGKLKQEDAEAYKKQVQKTSLYFTNPLWLDYTLNNESTFSQPSMEVPVTNAHLITEEELKFAPKVDDTPVQQESVEQAQEASAIEAPVADEPETFIQTEAIPETVTEPVNEVAVAPENIASVQDESIEQSGEEDVPPTEAIKEEEPALLEMKIAPLKMEPLPDPDAPLVFEAFHTVDYFASQGIKLKVDDLPKDKFGQQLKSFTEWLKILKKTTPTEIAKQVDKRTEEKVITLAEHSLENRDVVTEAMAEVWVKQGNRQKAIEVYNKLSLQNPAKSSYFAALIEQLKQQ